MLDVANLIDYMIVNQYGGNWDWPHNNWWATYNRDRAASGNSALDGEGYLSGTRRPNRVNEVRLRPGVRSTSRLRQVPEFCSCSPTASTAPVQRRRPDARRRHRAASTALAAEIDRAIVGESARWGDAKRSPEPCTRDDNWLAAANNVGTSTPTSRNGRPLCIQQFKDQGWYPNVDAPTLRINGVGQHGGTIELGDSLTIDRPGGHDLLHDSTAPIPRPRGGGEPDPADLYTGADHARRGRPRHGPRLQRRAVEAL